MPDKFPYAPLSELQRLRSYSRRKDDGTRETWDETCDRVLYSPYLGLKVLGKFSDEEMKLIDEELRERRGFGSARALWVMGTKWSSRDQNFNSLFNCTSMLLNNWDVFGDLMDLSMQGSGTGSVLELSCIDELPPIVNKLNVSITGEFGSTPAFARREDTEIVSDGDRVLITVGDSRQGWVKSYQALMEIASDETLSNELEVVVDISDVRSKGTKLKGFGGVANPSELPRMYVSVARTLNKAVGRKLNGLECCLILGDAAYAVVAGGIRRSAAMRQGSPNDETFTTSKDNLWIVDADGNWKIDPDRDSLRVGNHTIVFHHKPSLDECVESVRKQFYSGEGAIQYAPEAIARANADLLNTPEKKQRFLETYAGESKYGWSIGTKGYLRALYHSDHGIDISDDELNHRMHRYGLNPCGCR